MDGLTQRVDGLSQRLDGLTQEMHAGFERVDRRFDRVDGRLDRVEAAVLEHTRELKTLHLAVDRKVDRDEVEGIVERVVARRSPGPQT